MNSVHNILEMSSICRNLRRLPTIERVGARNSVTGSDRYALIVETLLS
jgi:hypothetical protein